MLRLEVLKNNKIILLRNYLLMLFLLFIVQYKVDGQRKRHTILWEISGNNLRKHSYLLGSMHTIDGNMFTAKYKIIKNKIKSTTMLVEETLLKNGEPSIDRSVLYFQKDSTIESVLSKEHYDSLVNYINKQTRNNQEILRNLIKMKPQLLMLAIQLIRGNPSQVNDTVNYMGMDEFILNFAEENGLETQGLENPTERSIALLNTVTSSTAIDRIFEEIKEDTTNSSISGNDKLLDKDSLDFVQLNIHYGFHYKVKSIMNDYGGVIARNKLWVNRISKLIRGQSCFIVVGLDHLKYHFGLIKQLRKLGYKVTPVSMN